MKLIDLLVKELPRRGGWPSEAVTAIYFSHKKGVTFYDKDGMSIRNGVSFIGMDINDVRREEVTKEEFEDAIAKNEDWIEWAGGERPVDSDAIVEIKFRWHNQHQYNNDRAGDFYWAHTGSNADIIAYRLQQPGIDTRTNDDQLEQDLNECIGQDIDIPEWDGEGLPPVGTICQAKVPRSITGWEWRRVKVVESGIPGAEKEVLVYDMETTIPSWTDEFRPLRTEAEKAREKLAASLHIAAGASPIELNGIGRLYFKLADAIISGSVFGTTFKAGK